MVGHYFQNAHLDVMAGVDELIRRGIADPDRMVKMGWSAGGHMTNKIITVTDRFKAAAAGAGVAQWMSMYAQSDIRSYRTPWFGGTPWRRTHPSTRMEQLAAEGCRERERRRCSLSAKNPRVPMPQSLEMYVVKSNGVPTHLYVVARASRLGRAPASADEIERRDRVVREIRHEAALHAGAGSR
jgi:poly(3-hydroxybutyrate) depolymerase